MLCAKSARVKQKMPGKIKKLPVNRWVFVYCAGGERGKNGEIKKIARLLKIFL